MKRILVLGALCCAAFSAAADLPEVENRTGSSTRQVLSLSERITRLEQQIGSPNTTLQLTQRVEALQQEIQELRGMVEDLQNRSQQPIVQTLQPSKAATITAPTEEGEQGLYQTAYHQLQARDYPAADNTLHALLAEYPDGENAPNAYYWLGEVAFIQGRTADAQKYFETVISKFPTHPKVSDALLKMGYIAYSNEDYPLSKKRLEQVMKEYPGSSAARLAEAKIQKMKKAGQL